MDKILLDTCVLIELFQSGESASKVEDWLNKNRERITIATTGIILTEISRGLTQKQFIVYQEFLENLEYLPTNREIYFLAGKLARELDQKGQRVPLSDCLIAAISDYYKTPIMTLDKHFLRFSELQLLFPENFSDD